MRSVAAPSGDHVADEAARVLVQRLQEATGRDAGPTSTREWPALGRTKKREESDMAGLKERMAGRFMQWEGKATGDPIRRAEGKLLATFGRLKRALRNARRRRAARPDAAAPTDRNRGI